MRFQVCPQRLLIVRLPFLASDIALVSIIIPHWRGKEILLRGLRALHEHTSPAHEIIIVDNGCDDGSVAAAQAAFPSLRVVSTGRNLGYAGGCNAGIRGAQGEYLVLLNNDAVVTPHWLEPLVEVLASDARIAACQPKILSLDQPGYFDYAGACGGFIDFWGYPFCRGRLFDTLEQDQNQYEGEADIFWASGACCLLRRSAVAEVGLLDETFFAHMEEIDLNWRLHLRGYRVLVVPAARVYHQAGSTLAAASPRKTYLNHRNGLRLLVKNDAGVPLLFVLPVRVGLDGVEALRQLLHGRVQHALMILRALLEVAVQSPALLVRRWQLQRRCQLSTKGLRAKFYRRSIVWDYFILRKRRFSDLPGSRS